MYLEKKCLVNKSVHVFLGGVLFITGCGKDDRTAQADQPFKEQLVGTWRGDCVELSADRFEKLRVEFKESKEVFAFQTIFSDKNCEQVSLGSIAFSGFYSAVESVQASLEGLVGGKDGIITWKFSAIDVSPTSSEFANDLNDQSFCGITDWNTEKSKTVSNKECQFFDGKTVNYPKLDTETTEKAEVIGNKLFLENWFRFGAKNKDTERYLKRD